MSWWKFWEGGSGRSRTTETERRKPEGKIKSYLCLFTDPRNYHNEVEGDAEISSSGNGWFRRYGSRTYSAYIVAAVKAKLGENVDSVLVKFPDRITFDNIVAAHDTAVYTSWSSSTTKESHGEVLEKIKNGTYILAIGSHLDKDFKEDEKKKWKWARVDVPDIGEAANYNPLITSTESELRDGKLKGRVDRL